MEILREHGSVLENGAYLLLLKTERECVSSRLKQTMYNLLTSGCVLLP